ncbi:MAG: molybdopterin-dependent oxidoreductase, partial [Pseudomonadota bacterium]
CRTDGAKLPSGNRAAYVGTAAVEDIDASNSILLIGTDPRTEAAVLNARIRRAWSRGATVGVIGPKVDLTFEYTHIGTDRAALEKALGNCERFAPEGSNPVIIVGQAALQGDDGAAVLAFVQKMCAVSQARLLVLHTAASRVGAMDIGATNPDGMAAIGQADVIYNLGADEIDIADGAFVIYQGS